MFQVVLILFVEFIILLLYLDLSLQWLLLLVFYGLFIVFY
jgi:hypothetical protein